MRGAFATFLLSLILCACKGGGSRDAATSAKGEGGRSPAETPKQAATDGAGSEGEAEPEREPLEQFMARFEQDAPSPPKPPTPAEAGQCPKGTKRDRDVGIAVSPTHATKGEEVRVIVSTLDGEEALAMRIELDGEEVEVEQSHRVGVPATTVGRFVPGESGRYQVVVGREGEGLRCRGFTVWFSPRQQEEPVDLSLVWPNERSWNAAEEALYSAWVRELFAGPPDEDLAWKALSEVTSDRQRNLLHNHLGHDEDDPKSGFELVPDCADTPYFLRAYWAYKRRLPFGFHKCTRGRGQAPTCFDLRTNLDPADRREFWIDPAPPKPEAPADPFENPETNVVHAVPDPPPPPPPDNAVVPTEVDKIEYFFKRSIGWSVHTGNGRCDFEDSSSDLYPVALDRRGLRPGIVYADPYGHILVLAELVAPRGSKPGILFAVDGQPDGSITRKRFWEGNFLWNQSDPSLGGSGFKAFRPLASVGGEGETERFVPLDNEMLAELRDYKDLSTMQGELSATEFYDRMERLITPGTRSPFAAQAELVAALAEAVRVRVTSVQNGVDYHRQNPDELVEMPWGHDVFETSGAWESYSTPARDLRLLIAMDVVLGFADKVRRNPEAFGLDPEREPEQFEEVLARLDEQRTQLLADPAHRITYRRSDGSEWSLGLDEVVARAERFEMAYNPNDCPEVRWGAPLEGEEGQTCTRRAPEEHRIKMRHYRVWFRERRRPARGDEGPEIPELAEEQALAQE